MVSSDSEPQDAGDPEVAPGGPEPTGSPGRRISRRLLVVAASLSLIAATAGVGMGWTAATALGPSSRPVASSGSAASGGSSSSSSAGGSFVPSAGGTQGTTTGVDLQAIASKVDPA